MVSQVAGVRCGWWSRAVFLGETGVVVQVFDLVGDAGGRGVGDL